MPLEEILVDGDVLDGLDAASGLMLRDGIDQGRRIALTEAVERSENVYGRHWASLSGLSSGRRCRGCQGGCRGAEVTAGARVLVLRR
jgi:hypothetical protein